MVLESVSSFVARFVFHQTRLYGFVPAMVMMARNKAGRAVLVMYALVRKTDVWRNLVHQWFAHGLKDSPAHIVNRISVPLKPPTEQRYLICIHPHGLLCDGYHMAVAKEPDAFRPDSNSLGGIVNLKPFLAFSPVIQYIPAHQELYRERCGGASSKNVEDIIRKTDCNPAICPGGFAEAVYCWTDGIHEHSWLKGNTRFMALAIKQKLDIIPSYTYGVTSMYRTNTLFRPQLAELAQKYSVPLVPFWGKFFGYPLHEDAVTVMYDPFPVDQYSVERPGDVDRALEDYQVYLRKCFDSDKGKYGMGDKELLFIGPRDKGKAKPPPMSKL